MWMETTKKDIIVLCQGMGKDAFIFYHHFWGVVAKVDTPKPEKVFAEEKCIFRVHISPQISSNLVEAFIKKSWGDSVKNYVFKYKYTGQDSVGTFANRLKINLKK